MYLLDRDTLGLVGFLESNRDIGCILDAAAGHPKRGAAWSLKYVAEIVEYKAVTDVKSEEIVGYYENTLTFAPPDKLTVKRGELLLPKLGAAYNFGGVDPHGLQARRIPAYYQFSYDHKGVER